MESSNPVLPGSSRAVSAISAQHYGRPQRARPTPTLTLKPDTDTDTGPTAGPSDGPLTRQQIGAQRQIQGTGRGEAGTTRGSTGPRTASGVLTNSRRPLNRHLTPPQIASSGASASGALISSRRKHAEPLRKVPLIQYKVLNLPLQVHATNHR